MKIFHNIAFAAALTVLSVATHAADMTVQSRTGEKWWGIFVGNTPVQPLPPGSFIAGQSFAGGFTGQLLVSNLGRYIYCPPRTSGNFDGTAFNLSYDGDQPEVAEAGRTLRDAYRVAWLKYFPSNGVAPSQEIYTAPLYDTSHEFGSLPTQGAVVGYAERLVREGFPVGTILVGDGWSDVPGTYTFSPAAFPDPKGMVDRLHALGFKVMLTVTPYAALSGRTFIENMRRGFLLRLADKGALTIRQNGGYYAVYDLNDEQQVEYVRDAVLRLISDYGVDGMRFDCQELLLSDPQPERLMGRWTEIGRGMELAEYCPGENLPHTPYVNVISGDRNVRSGAPVKYQIAALAGASMCGYNGCRFTPSVLADTASLFDRQWLMARILQMQALSPVPTVDFAPWRVTDKALYDAVKQFLVWRASIGSYIADAHKECVATGEPLFRPMEYAFPRGGFSDCSDQFMLGVRYLCAPFCDGDGRRLVRLPRGVWTDLKGKRFKGPLVITVKQGDSFCPIFELSSK